MIRGSWSFVSMKLRTFVAEITALFALFFAYRYGKVICSI